MKLRESDNWGGIAVKTYTKRTCSHLNKINKRSFEPFCVWILFWNASSRSVSDFHDKPVETEV